MAAVARWREIVAPWLHPSITAFIEPVPLEADSLDRPAAPCAVEIEPSFGLWIRFPDYFLRRMGESESLRSVREAIELLHIVACVDPLSWAALLIESLGHDAQRGRYRRRLVPRYVLSPHEERSSGAIAELSRLRELAVTFGQDDMRTPAFRRAREQLRRLALTLRKEGQTADWDRIKIEVRLRPAPGSPMVRWQLQSYMMHLRDLLQQVHERSSSSTPCFEISSLDIRLDEALLDTMTILALHSFVASDVRDLGFIESDEWESQSLHSSLETLCVYVPYPIEHTPEYAQRLRRLREAMELVGLALQLDCAAWYHLTDANNASLATFDPDDYSVEDLTPRFAIKAYNKWNFGGDSVDSISKVNQLLLGIDSDEFSDEYRICRDAVLAMDERGVLTHFQVPVALVFQPIAWIDPQAYMSLARGLTTELYWKSRQRNCAGGATHSNWYPFALVELGLYASEVTVSDELVDTLDLALELGLAVPEISFEPLVYCDSALAMLDGEQSRNALPIARWLAGYHEDRPDVVPPVLPVSHDESVVQEPCVHGPTQTLDSIGYEEDEWAKVLVDDSGTEWMQVELPRYGARWVECRGVIDVKTVTTADVEQNCLSDSSHIMTQTLREFRYIWDDIGCPGDVDHPDKAGIKAFLSMLPRNNVLTFFELGMGKQFHRQFFEEFQAYDGVPMEDPVNRKSQSRWLH
ncbi:hypothetical protein ATCC90586_000394 [Pythium insidiosum]|nr:hypothetical protein ATCC90586_000394 [Pythium insidiosum]